MSKWDKHVEAELLEALNRLRLAEQKLEAILDVFRNQSSQVILWNPAKTHYAWQYPFTAKGAEMLYKILDIALGEDGDE